MAPSEIGKLEEELRLAESQSRAEKATFDRCNAAAEAFQEEAAVARRELAAANIPSSPRIASQEQEDAVVARQAAQSEERRLAAEVARAQDVCAELQGAEDRRREAMAARLARLRHAEVQVCIEPDEAEEEEATEIDPFCEVLAYLARECERRTQSSMELQERLAAVRQLERVAVAGADPIRVAELAELHRESAAQLATLRHSVRSDHPRASDEPIPIVQTQGGSRHRNAANLEAEAAGLAREFWHIHSESRHGMNPPDLTAEVQALRVVLAEHETLRDAAERNIAKLHSTDDPHRSEGKKLAFDPPKRTQPSTSLRLPSSAVATTSWSHAHRGGHLPTPQGSPPRRVSGPSTINSLRNSQGTIHRPSLASVTTACVQVAPRSQRVGKRTVGSVEQPRRS